MKRHKNQKPLSTFNQFGGLRKKVKKDDEDLPPVEREQIEGFRMPAGEARVRKNNS